MEILRSTGRRRPHFSSARSWPLKPATIQRRRMGVAMVRSKGGAGPRDANQTPNQRKKRSRDSEREREKDFTDLLATVRRPATGAPVPARRPPRRGGQRKKKPPPPKKKKRKKPRPPATPTVRPSNHQARPRVCGTVSGRK